MKSLGLARWQRYSLGLLLAFALASPGCRYSVDPDSGRFHCDSDDDCGGGWHCFSSCVASGFSPYCLENGSCEACPNLQSDPLNCGTCGAACASGDECIDGVCVPSILPDAGQPDSGFDAGPQDAGPDAGIDGGPDGGRDAGEDAGTDAGRDGGPEDAGLADGSVDGGDAGEPDASVDAGPEDGGVPDASTDGGASDAGDGGVDSGS